ncbi:MAG TPA: hypothetical protein VHW90_05960, partial [Stellaceae bacterium]|nr:hypothetical protein [Stellaceae bacterium]
MHLTNVYRESVSALWGSCRTWLALLLVLPLAVSVATADQRDSLTIGITQFPSTLNPNIDPMAAKVYVLGMTTRPFTAYDADWKS